MAQSVKHVILDLSSGLSLEFKPHTGLRAGHGPYFLNK